MGAPDEFHPEAHEKAKEITGNRRYGEWGQCVASRNNVDERCKGFALGPHGKCHSHGGKTPTAEENPRQGRGDQDGNQNAQTHALFSSKDGYYHNLDDGEQEWVFDFTHTLLDRHRRVHGEEPDMFDKEALKNIAIDYHRVADANEWFSENGLVNQDIERGPESFKKTTKVNVWAKEIRQYNESIYRRMEKHGLLNDPESKKADAMGNVLEEWKHSAAQ